MTSDDQATPVAPRAFVAPLPRIGGVQPQIVRNQAGIELTYAGHLPLPNWVPIFAADAGEVKQVIRTGRLMTLELAHGSRSVSRYIGIALMLVPADGRLRPHHVDAGDVIGYVRRDILRLGFQLVRCDGQDEIDLLDSTQRWSFLPWFTSSRELGREFQRDQRRDLHGRA